MKDGKFARNNETTQQMTGERYGASVHYWANIKNRAKELIAKAVPGVDYCAFRGRSLQIDNGGWCGSRLGYLRTDICGTCLHVAERRSWCWLVRNLLIAGLLSRPKWASRTCL